MAKPHFRCLSAVLGLLAMAATAPASAETIFGQAEAIDGDTLSFTGLHVRLFGIDAVELYQTCKRDGGEWKCGEEARDRLGELVAEKMIQCSGSEHDTYGRLVAVCRDGSVELGEEMVLSGYAIAYREFSEDYVEVEQRAKRFGLGVWASEFENPADWRAAHPLKAPTPSGAAVPAAKAAPRVYRDSSGRCAIKGNHSRKGEWIYHLPGQAYYDQTRPEELFCTEEQAVKAGYRRSKV